MTKKRIMTFLLAICFIIPTMFMFAGCELFGSSNDSGKNDGGQTPPPSQPVVEASVEGKTFSIDRVEFLWNKGVTRDDYFNSSDNAHDWEADLIQSTVSKEIVFTFKADGKMIWSWFDAEDGRKDGMTLYYVADGNDVQLYHNMSHTNKMEDIVVEFSEDCNRASVYTEFTEFTQKVYYRADTLANKTYVLADSYVEWDSEADKTAILGKWDYTEQEYIEHQIGIASYKFKKGNVCIMQGIDPDGGEEHNETNYYDLVGNKVYFFIDQDMLAYIGEGESDYFVVSEDLSTLESSIRLEYEEENAGCTLHIVMQVQVEA